MFVLVHLASPKFRNTVILRNYMHVHVHTQSSVIKSAWLYMQVRGSLYSLHFIFNVICDRTEALIFVDGNNWVIWALQVSFARL